MKQTDKNRSSLVAATLVIGTVFILSIVYQNWTVEDVVQGPVAFNEEVPTDENISFEELVDDFDIEVEVVYSSEDDNKPVELSFSDAFTLAREELGPGCTFVWNDNLYSTDRADDYQLDLIGREYCRDRSIGCEKKEFDQLMVWQVAKSKLIQCHTKWIETILEQCKLLKSVLRDHIYLEQTIELCNKMGITINETDILATTSKGIVVSNVDVLSHLETLKNKEQTREQKIALRRLYDQQQASN